MNIPAVPADVAKSTFDAIATSIDLGHKQRVKVIVESALAMALKLKLEGKMSTPEWDALEAAINSIEQSGTATIALIAKLGPAAIPPESIALGAKRLQAVATAMQAAVAEHTVANSQN